MEFLAPTRLYINPADLELGSDFEIDEDQYEYLTTGMVKLFRSSEIRRLQEMQEESEEEEEEVLENIRLRQLKKLLDTKFNRGVTERKPILWPVLPMSF
jgi:hypothetical protein